MSQNAMRKSLFKIKKEGRNGLAEEWMEEYEKKNLALWTSFNQPFSNHR